MTLEYGVYYLKVFIDFSFSDHILLPNSYPYTEGNCQDGDVRLINGTTQYEGRIQLCNNTHWASVYSYPQMPWRTAEAIVVCRQLGYATIEAKVYTDNRFGAGSSQTWVTGVRCSSYESKLQLCQYQLNGYYQYSNYYTATMGCLGENN